MKKLISTALLLLLSTNFYSQKVCITGNLNIVLGQTNTFTSTGIAQCLSCYDWDINNNSNSSDNSIVGTVQILGTDMSNSVNIKGISLGPFTLSLNYITESGCNQCIITGNVIPAQVSCQFVVNSSSPFIASENSTPPTVTIFAFTIPSLSGVTYNWMANYQDGSTAGASGTSNSATFVAYQSNPIVSVNIIAYYLTCTSTFLRTFTVPIFGGEPGNKIGERIDIISVAPNPTNSYLNFKGKDLEKYSISIFDINGNEVIKKDRIDENVSIENNKNGVYYYVISDKNGYKQEGKIVKE